MCFCLETKSQSRADPDTIAASFRSKSQNRQRSVCDISNQRLQFTTDVMVIAAAFN